MTASVESLLSDPRLDWSLLRRHRFSPERWLEHASRAASGQATPESALIAGEIVPAPAVTAVDYTSSRDRQAREAGEAALRAGAVAMIVLNGGMATRFGGLVKGTVEVLDGRSFIGLKCEDAQRTGVRYGRTPPVVLMNSFATDAATQEHLEKNGHFGLTTENVFTFCQSISVRLQPNGEIFLGADGRPSYYAPGHGDFFAAIRVSGVLAQLRERGISHLLFSNVDNLGATIDPTLIGLHRLAGSDMTVELTARRQDAAGAWDVGGAPVLLDGRLCVVEGFRFPPGVQEALPDFQTNNMLFDTAGIDRQLPLVEYPVAKQVDGRTALQFEAITCEASLAVGADGLPLLALGLLQVPREGPRGRFYPIKTPADLEQLRPTLRQRLEAGWQNG